MPQRLYLAVIFALALGAEAAAQQTYDPSTSTYDENLTHCKYYYKEACTALIDSGKESQKMLSYLHMKRAEAITYYGDISNLEAIADFEEAFKLKPDTLTAAENEEYYPAYKGLRLAYSKRFQNDDITSLDEKAMRIWPKKLEPYMNHAEQCAKNGEYAKAIADYTQAISLQPNEPRLFTARSQLYLASIPAGDADPETLKKALADIDRTIKLGDTNYKIDYSTRAQLYERLGDYEKAVADYTMLIRMDLGYTRQTDYTNYLKRGDVYFLLKQFDKAKTDYESAAESSSSDIDSTIHYDLGRVYNQLQLYQKAVTEFTIALKIAGSIDDNSLKYYAGRSEAYAHLGLMAKAKEDAEKAHEPDPSGQGAKTVAATSPAAPAPAFNIIDSTSPASILSMGNAAAPATRPAAAAAPVASPLQLPAPAANPGLNTPSAPTATPSTPPAPGMATTSPAAATPAPAPIAPSPAAPVAPAAPRDPTAGPNPLGGPLN